MLADMSAPRGKLAAPLVAWFRRHARDLPWRRLRDPWRVLVSEFMLQQTRVEVVTRYFDRFLERFPDARALAGSDEAELLRYWSGLGYYSRARNLMRAAKHVVLHHDGAIPADLEQIRELPGVGRYTAGAVASIAFDIAAPLVDGNVARVLARHFLVEGELRQPHAARRFWELAEEELDRERPGDFNQALMELGATVCLPKTPRCLICPVEKTCAARNANAVDKYPTPRARRESVPVRLAAALIRKDGKVGVVRRKAGSLMGGLFDLPAIELAPEADARKALSRHVSEALGVKVRALEPLGEVRHTITFRRIRVEVYDAFWAGRHTGTLIREAPAGERGASPVAPIADEGGLRFVAADELDALGLSALGRKMLELAAEEA